MFSAPLLLLDASKSLQVTWDCPKVSDTDIHSGIWPFFLPSPLMGEGQGEGVKGPMRPCR